MVVELWLITVVGHSGWESLAKHLVVLLRLLSELVHLILLWLLHLLLLHEWLLLLLRWHLRSKPLIVPLIEILLECISCKWVLLLHLLWHRSSKLLLLLHLLPIHHSNLVCYCSSVRIWLKASRFGCLRLLLLLLRLVSTEWISSENVFSFLNWHLWLLLWN